MKKGCIDLISNLILLSDLRNLNEDQKSIFARYPKICMSYRLISPVILHRTIK